MSHQPPRKTPSGAPLVVNDHEYSVDPPRQRTRTQSIMPGTHFSKPSPISKPPTNNSPPVVAATTPLTNAATSAPGIVRASKPVPSKSRRHDHAQRSVLITTDLIYGSPVPAYNTYSSAAVSTQGGSGSSPILPSAQISTTPSVTVDTTAPASPSEKVVPAPSPKAGPSAPASKSIFSRAWAAITPSSRAIAENGASSTQHAAANDDNDEMCSIASDPESSALTATETSATASAIPSTNQRGSSRKMFQFDGISGNVGTDPETLTSARTSVQTDGIRSAYNSVKIPSNDPASAPIFSAFPQQQQQQQQQRQQPVSTGGSVSPAPHPHQTSRDSFDVAASQPVFLGVKRNHPKAGLVSPPAPPPKQAHSGGAHVFPSQAHQSAEATSPKGLQQQQQQQQHRFSTLPTGSAYGAAGGHRRSIDAVRIARVYIAPSVLDLPAQVVASAAETASPSLQRSPSSQHNVQSPSSRRPQQDICLTCHFRPTGTASVDHDHILRAILLKLHLSSERVEQQQQQQQQQQQLFPNSPQSGVGGGGKANIVGNDKLLQLLSQQQQQQQSEYTSDNTTTTDDHHFQGHNGVADSNENSDLILSPITRQAFDQNDFVLIPYRPLDQTALDSAVHSNLADPLALSITGFINDFRLVRRFQSDDEDSDENDENLTSSGLNSPQSPALPGGTITPVSPSQFFSSSTDNVIQEEEQSEYDDDESFTTARALHGRPTVGQSVFTNASVVSITDAKHMHNETTDDILIRNNTQQQQQQQSSLLLSPLSSSGLEIQHTQNEQQQHPVISPSTSHHSTSADTNTNNLNTNNQQQQQEQQPCAPMPRPRLSMSLDASASSSHHLPADVPTSPLSITSAGTAGAATTAFSQKPHDPTELPPLPPYQQLIGLIPSIYSHPNQVITDTPVLHIDLLKVNKIKRKLPRTLTFTPTEMITSVPHRAGCQLTNSNGSTLLNFSASNASQHPGSTGPGGSTPGGVSATPVLTSGLDLLSGGSATATATADHPSGGANSPRGDGGVATQDDVAALSHTSEASHAHSPYLSPASSQHQRNDPSGAPQLATVAAAPLSSQFEDFSLGDPRVPLSTSSHSLNTAQYAQTRCIRDVLSTLPGSMAPYTSFISENSAPGDCFRCSKPTEKTYNCPITDVLYVSVVDPRSIRITFIVRTSQTYMVDNAALVATCINAYLAMQRQKVTSAPLWNLNKVVASQRILSTGAVRYMAARLSMLPNGFIDLTDSHYSATTYHLGGKKFDLAQCSHYGRSIVLARSIPQRVITQHLPREYPQLELYSVTHGKAVTTDPKELEAAEKATAAAQAAAESDDADSDLAYLNPVALSPNAKWTPMPLLYHHAPTTVAADCLFNLFLTGGTSHPSFVHTSTSLLAPSNTTIASAHAAADDAADLTLSSTIPISASNATSTGTATPSTFSTSGGATPSPLADQITPLPVAQMSGQTWGDFSTCIRTDRSFTDHNNQLTPEVVQYMIAARKHQLEQESAAATTAAPTSPSKPPLATALSAITGPASPASIAPTHVSIIASTDTAAGTAAAVSASHSTNGSAAHSSNPSSSSTASSTSSSLVNSTTYPFPFVPPRLFSQMLGLTISSTLWRLVLKTLLICFQPSLYRTVVTTIPMINAKSNTMVSEWSTSFEQFRQAYHEYYEHILEKIRYQNGMKQMEHAAKTIYARNDMFSNNITGLDTNSTNQLTHNGGLSNIFEPVDETGEEGGSSSTDTTPNTSISHPSSSQQLTTNVTAATATTTTTTINPTDGSTLSSSSSSSAAATTTTTTTPINPAFIPAHGQVVHSTLQAEQAILAQGTTLATLQHISTDDPKLFEIHDPQHIFNQRYLTKNLRERIAIINKEGSVLLYRTKQLTSALAAYIQQHHYEELCEMIHQPFTTTPNIFTQNKPSYTASPQQIQHAHGEDVTDIESTVTHAIQFGIELVICPPITMLLQTYLSIKCYPRDLKLYNICCQQTSTYRKQSDYNIPPHLQTADKWMTAISTIKNIVTAQTASESLHCLLTCCRYVYHTYKLLLQTRREACQILKTHADMSITQADLDQFQYTTEQPLRLQDYHNVTIIRNPHKSLCMRIQQQPEREWRFFHTKRNPHAQPEPGQIDKTKYIVRNTMPTITQLQEAKYGIFVERSQLGLPGFVVRLDDVGPTSPLCADDFFPIFAYIIIQAKITRLETVKQFIGSMAPRVSLTGEIGYYFTVFEAVIEYIDTLDMSSAPGQQ